MLQELKTMVFTPEAVLVLGTFDAEGKPNAMNAAWGIQTDMKELSISMASHKTTDNLEVNPEFTVAFATEETMVIADYFGVASGRNEDKIAKAGVHFEKAPHINAPIFQKFPLTLECKVTSFDNGILVGEVVGVLADDSILTDGKVDLDKLHPIIFDSSMNKYRKVGSIAGDAFKAGLSLK